MTIALGLLCEGGVIVAADTQVMDMSGATTQNSKIVHFVSNNGAFAIANASEDAYAAATMISKIKVALEGTAFKSWTDVEDVISYEMSDFSQPFSSPPQHQLIVAGFVENLGTALYFCEPPKTVVPKMREQYISAGAGFSVADPLKRTLFTYTSHFSPQLVLRQIAYLMYRTKKDLASYCGGDTVAFYICADGRDPEMVRIEDFRAAEKEAHQLDMLLQFTAKTALGCFNQDLKTDSGNVALSISQSTTLRNVVFRNSQLEPITPPGEKP